MGTHLAGGVVVPVNTQYRKGELGHIFGDAGVRLCLTDEERKPELDRTREDLPELRRSSSRPRTRRFPRVAGRNELKMPRGEDLAVIAYTSGTTGRSKGAMLLHRNLARQRASGVRGLALDGRGIRCCSPCRCSTRTG